MKKLILNAFAIATLCFSTAAIYANVGNRSAEELKIVKVADDQKVEISASDLPEAIKESWTESKYKADKVEKIYQVTTEKGKQYEFVVMTDAGKKSVQMDAKGKILSEKAAS